MTRLQQIICILLLAGATFLVATAKKHQARPQPQPAPQAQVQPPPPDEPPVPLPPPPKVEPQWTHWPRVRQVNNPSLGKVLQDIDSHMPQGHRYSASNKITWAHETTHGINANIRNAQPNASGVNGFYALEDRAVVIEEPRTTISKVAPLVPQKLRGVSYNLYLVKQQSGWNDRPLYLFDEWTAYTNGSECGRELNGQGWYFELLQAHEFNVYCMCLAKLVKETCPQYDDRQLKAYMMFNVERTFRLAEPAPKRDVLRDPFDHHMNITLLSFPDDDNPTQKALEYVNKVRTLHEAEELRAFARQYFGPEWCKRIYGF
jgi:hypothetical protein